MIKYHLKKNNVTGSAAYGKYYAYPVIEETIDLEGLAAHMEAHNTGFGRGMTLGILVTMVSCIKEMLLEGKNVKIDNLAIFSCGIKNKQGAATEEEFSVQNNISGVKLRARATGTLSNAKLNLEASIKKVSLGSATSGSSSGGGSSSSGGTKPSGGGGSSIGGDL